MEPTDKILQIVGNETRRKILTLLSEEPRYISEIAKKLEVTQPAILKHLSIVEKAGLIESFWRNSPAGAARKYYRICESVGVEIAINPKRFEVNKQPQKTSCPKYLEAERTIKQLTEETNKAKDLTAKAAKARELMKAAESLLACPDFEKGKWNCETCHQVASLRKDASQIILHVSSGDVESGLRKLIDAVDQIATGLQPSRKH
ncbi:MAG: ArsR family transcriptional regulator [Candidatus Bathyarchaeia archaeon]|jgi:predicted transcriptional regulator